MEDPTEGLRRTLVQYINNAVAGLPDLRTRKRLEAEFGQVWDTTTLPQDFEVLGFLAPFVRVRRKSDNLDGTLTFTHSPRFYFDFQPTTR